MPQQMTGNDRHPLEAKAMGVLQHGRLKINIFSILWSDHNDILIYRKYEDFKKLNRELRKKFPLESGLLRKSDNMIPKLKDVPIFRKNRNTSRFIERLRLLEVYCQQLLTADEKISHCDVVTGFFTPKSNDLNPNFPENSLMIMPSEAREQQRERPRLQPKPPATEPIVSQMYLCIEDHETKDTKNRPFKVKRNEHMGVLIKENSGWWLVENEEKRVAWFPAPFLKALNKEDDLGSGTDSDDEGIRYYSTMAYEALSWDEVSISRGVLVEVKEKSNNGWWLIRYNGKTGFVPAMYLKPYRNCHQLQINKNHEKFPSTSNLFKASSLLELSRPTEAWRMEKEHNMGKTQWVGGPKLDRKKSRSISVIPSSPAYGFYFDPAELVPRDHTQEVQHLGKGQTPTHKNGMKDAIRKLSAGSDASSERPPRPHLQSQILCDQQELHKQSLSKTKPPSGQSTSTLPRTPLMPQRPKAYEILHRCSTVTKKAFETKEATDMQG
ncbi:PREDICTED: NADPH oxidase organizer 1-like [Nanorana parkeri]|uniref:NADPH oxidase organizer 1-like n=1 Tax=Nanorana parkeri TaxID=125878 RepID=UPI000854CFF3|nr:PREDICTED: NADPH oxidase organizer 1-like [Nanorana parkeri]